MVRIKRFPGVAVRGEELCQGQATVDYETDQQGTYAALSLRNANGTAFVVYIDGDELRRLGEHIVDRALSAAGVEE